MNIAGQIFDVYDDVQLKVAAEHKSELSGATVLDPVEVEKLDDKDFALVIKTGSQKIRKYPIVDSDSVKLSSCYFASQKRRMHPEIAKTAEAGFARKGNEIDISKLAATPAVTHSFKGYPLHDELHVKEAIARFDYTTQRMRPVEKYAYAQAIVERASDLKVMVDGNVLNYVNPEINPVSVKLGCDMRKALLLDTKSKHDLQKLANNPSPMAFEYFDKTAGLTQYVADGKLPDGYETCFSTIKLADLDEYRVKNIPLTKIEALFDAAFAKEWAKDPYTVFKSLPDPTKQMIEKNAGIAEMAIPAAMAMLAVGATMKNRGAKSIIDKQFASKGWWVSDKPGILYENNNRRIIRQDGQYKVVDFDGHVKSTADSLTKLVLEV